MVMAAISTLICEIISYILQIILFSMSIDVWPFIKIIVLEIVFNSLIIMIMYPIIEKMGILLEKIFTKDKVLTRYY